MSVPTLVKLDEALADYQQALACFNASVTTEDGKPATLSSEQLAKVKEAIENAGKDFGVTVALCLADIERGACKPSKELRDRVTNIFERGAAVKASATEAYIILKDRIAS